MEKKNKVMLISGERRVGITMVSVYLAEQQFLERCKNVDEI